MSKLTPHQVKEFYQLPEKVVFCKKCVVSNQRPRIAFDKNGICNACNYAYKKHNLIDWNEREKELSLEEGYGIQLSPNGISILNKIKFCMNQSTETIFENYFPEIFFRLLGTGFYF